MQPSTSPSEVRIFHQQPQCISSYRFYRDRRFQEKENPNYNLFEFSGEEGGRGERQFVGFESSGKEYEQNYCPSQTC